MSEELVRIAYALERIADSLEGMNERDNECRGEGCPNYVPPELNPEKWQWTGPLSKRPWLNNIEDDK